MLNRFVSSLVSSRAVRAAWNYLQPPPGRSLRQRLGSILLILIASYVTLGNGGCFGCGIFGYRQPRVGVTPLIVGDNGVQTGIASFLGNFTAITQPSGSYFVLARAQNCSLTLMTGTKSSNNVTLGAQTANYERTLHQLASLTTTPDLYPLGCSDTTVGRSTQPGVFVQRNASGLYIFALAAENSSTGSNAVFVLTGTATGPTGSFNALTSLSNATGLTTADLNGDGNGDLIVVNGYAPSSSFVSVLLGNGDGTFKTPVSYATGGTRSAAATVDDFNGDGKLDIVSIADDQTVSVLTGRGDGTFNAAANFAARLPAGSTSTAVVNLISTDVNGDGKKDIIGSNGLVLLGNGDGTFHELSTVAFPVATSINSEGPNLAAGDLNKDGKMDLVLSTGMGISVWLGNGDGTFKAGAAYSSIENSGFVSVTDLDGDGNLDIYSGLANGGLFTGDDTNENTAYALMGNGDGTFVGAPAANATYNGTNLADLNADGYPDLLVPTSGTVSGQTAVFTVEKGSAKGIFAPFSTVTAPATVTFTVSQLLIPVTESTSNLTPASYAIGDVNGDGKPDIAYVSNYRGYAVYFVALGNGDGTFASAVATGFPRLAPSTGYDITTFINSVRIGDFNHDGKADILFNYNDVAGPFGTGLYLDGLGILPGNGDGTFGSPILTSVYSSGTDPSSASPLPVVSSIADINQDGYPDVIATNASFSVTNGVGKTTSTVQIFLGKADGTFAAPVVAITTPHLGQVTVADLNKDGKLDIAALTETDLSQAQLAIATGKGDGTFMSPVLSNLAGGDAIRSSGLVAADFDGDGSTDLALLDANDFSGVFYGKGDGTFTSVPNNGNIVPKDLISIVDGGTSAAVDLNKDGKIDIFSGQTVLLNIYGSAPVVTQYGTTTTLAASSTSVAPGASVTLSATVAGAAGSSGTPAGTITFLDGTSALGTVTLDGTGKASLTTSALVSAGTHNLTAVYSGSATFLGSSSAVIAVSVTVPGASFSIALSPSSATVIHGNATSTTATITPINGFKAATALSCTGAPTNATCTVSPATVTPDGSTATTATVSITTGTATARIEKVRNLQAVACALAGLFALVGVVRRRNRIPSLLLLGLLAVMGLGLNGCGGKKNTSTTTTGATTPAGTYTLVVNASSGSLSQTANFTLTVQ